jgi:predicted DNA-binding transcriptional regulator YafY
MSKLISLYRQLEIIKLARKGPFDWTTLNALLESKSASSDMELFISKRTLTRDLKEINELFGQVISFDYKSGRYQMDLEESFETHLELLESFDTIQAFGRPNRLAGKVYFEKRSARGTEYLKGLLDAIENSEAVWVEYVKFWTQETEKRILRPIALKEYLHRWYMLAWRDDDQLRFFGLDRIKAMETLPGKVKLPKAQDLNNRFLETIGIINNPDEPVETVTLTFTRFKGQYILSIPLHPTQQILMENESVIQVSIRVKLNYELVSVILSHGDEVRVDHPQRLKEMIREKAENILKGSLNAY